MPSFKELGKNLLQKAICDSFGIRTRDPNINLPLYVTIAKQMLPF